MRCTLVGWASLRSAQCKYNQLANTKLVIFAIETLSQQAGKPG